MSDDDTPKSAFDLVMARLNQKDRDAGVEKRALTDEQRQAIAEARKIYQARLAEREIMYRSQLAKADPDPAAIEKIEEEYRRDRERIGSDRERKLEEIRAGKL